MCISSDCFVNFSHFNVWGVDFITTVCFFVIWRSQLKCFTMPSFIFVIFQMSYVIIVLFYPCPRNMKIHNKNITFKIISKQIQFWNNHFDIYFVKGIYIWLSHSCGIISNKQSDFGLNKDFWKNLCFWLPRRQPFWRLWMSCWISINCHFQLSCNFVKLCKTFT